jgi:hypothetical protein
MSLNSCFFVAQLADPQARERVQRRIDALTRFYEPLGGAQTTSTYMDPLRLMVGHITFDRSPVPEPPLAWGGPLPTELSDEETLVRARDSELRAADGIVVAFGTTEAAARLISGSGGVATLHRARSADAEAFATHAVAAAWLATGQATLDTDRIPELIARQYVGDNRTLIAEARVMPPATKVDFTADGARHASYWSAAERWAPVEEERAYEHTRVALMDALERRVPKGNAYLGLTGGLDSRVLGVALRELGRLDGSFTWGKPEWDDSVEAAGVAARLGVEHSLQPIEYRSDDEALRLIDAEARWHEGAAAVRFVAQTWPNEMRAAVYGVGGEIGRAFYYGGELARLFPDPSQTQLQRIFDGRGFIRGAHRDAVANLRAAERSWIAAAHQLGVSGWRCLDVLYADQRVWRWGRYQLARSDALTVPGFATPQVARGLASMPLKDRLTSGFHRRFLSSHPDLSAPDPSAPSTYSHVRRALMRLPGARDGIVARRVRRHPPPLGRWGLADEWRSRPRVRSWVVEEGLGSALLRDALGARWVERTRERFLSDETRATETALLASAPVALDQALRDLAND